MESSRACPCPRGSPRTHFQVLGLGLGLVTYVFGLGLGLESQDLDPGLGLGLGSQVLGLIGHGLAICVLDSIIVS